MSITLGTNTRVRPYLTENLGGVGRCASFFNVHRVDSTAVAILFSAGFMGVGHMMMRLKASWVVKCGWALTILGGVCGIGSLRMAHAVQQFAAQSLGAISAYEGAGNYAAALDAARSDYISASSRGLGKEAARLAEDIERLEAKLLGFGSSHLLVDEQGLPRVQLVRLLDILGMPQPSEGERSLLKINEWAQKNLLRQGERWEEQTARFEELRPTIQPLLADLGFVNELPPHFQEYEGALIHGALLARERLRLYYLVEQWNRGARFHSLYFLSGERPLEPKYENPETFVNCENSPLKIRQDWTPPLKWPRTESEMTRLVWEQSEIPAEMRESVEVHFISAPMKEDAKNGKMVRPTTDDTVVYWLKDSPRKGNYLAVTNAPYINRQDLVVRAIAPVGEYGFDTVGSAAGKNEQMAIFLDELARYLFTSFSKRQE